MLCLRMILRSARLSGSMRMKKWAINGIRMSSRKKKVVDKITSKRSLKCLWLELVALNMGKLFIKKILTGERTGQYSS